MAIGDTGVQPPSDGGSSFGSWQQADLPDASPPPAQGGMFEPDAGGEDRENWNALTPIFQMLANIQARLERLQDGHAGGNALRVIPIRMRVWGKIAAMSATVGAVAAVVGQRALDSISSFFSSSTPQERPPLIEEHKTSIPLSREATNEELIAQRINDRDKKKV